MIEDKVTILCSGVTLGIYVPALVINYQLKEQGVSSDVVVLEELFLGDKQKKLLDMKIAFHRNFSFALMGQKFTKGIWDNLNSLAIEKMFNTWKFEKRRRFHVFSGFWIPIVEQYIEQMNATDISVDLCHMDATTAVSWQSFENEKPYYNHWWFFNWENKRISYYIDIANKEPVAFNDRSDRIIIHGGGWGIGTYKELIPELFENGIKLDVIAYEDKDINNRVDSNRYFLLKPDWNAWERDKNNNPQFPPLGEVKDNEQIEYRNNDKYSEVFNIIQYNQAIISKPGGATLIDSLSSATPVIFLDPFGKYESKNALLWEHFGFGISYEKWKDTNFSLAVLEKLHKNLLMTRAKLQNFIEVINAT